MSVMDIFWVFIYKYHPKLAIYDWLVDSQLVRREDIVSNEVRAMVPEGMINVNCFVFFYKGGTKNVVYLLQDNKAEKSIAIGLLKNDELVNAIKL
ncbi:MULTISPECIES: hypothetical protein [Paraliobacillus]|uniref:hypothetical protein n=1 Tax=Paraliobacillus TaxID=200903 RepID=UPI000E3B8395|nr:MULTISPECIES: hypothetical protein [Paraliobacillus]